MPSEFTHLISSEIHVAVCFSLIFSLGGWMFFFIYMYMVYIFIFILSSPCPRSPFRVSILLPSLVCACIYNCLVCPFSVSILECMSNMLQKCIRMNTTSTTLIDMYIFKFNRHTTAKLCEWMSFLFDTNKFVRLCVYVTFNLLLFFHLTPFYFQKKAMLNMKPNQKKKSFNEIL